MENIEFHYLSQEGDVKIREYGRNVQKLVAHCRTIADKEERTAFAEKIIEMMGYINPQPKGEDTTHKMWLHLMRIADFDLDVNLPEDLPALEERHQPERVPYPKGDPKYRHYGNGLFRMIEKAAGMEEGPIRDEYIHLIGVYMKLCYKSWNKDPNVADEAIKRDLEKFSEGKIQLPDNVSFEPSNKQQAARRAALPNNNNTSRHAGNPPRQNKRGRGGSARRNNNNNRRKY